LAKEELDSFIAFEGYDFDLTEEEMFDMQQAWQEYEVEDDEVEDISLR
jgi:hypothetical protein